MVTLSKGKIATGRIEPVSPGRGHISEDREAVALIFSPGTSTLSSTMVPAAFNPPPELSPANPSSAIAAKGRSAAGKLRTPVRLDDKPGCGVRIRYRQLVVARDPARCACNNGSRVSGDDAIMPRACTG